MIFDICTQFCFSSNDKVDDDTNLGNAVCFAWFKRNDDLEHACAVMEWALSLNPEICADCSNGMSTQNGDLTKFIDEVVACLHTPPCPSKNSQQKVLMTSLIFSQKSLKILLLALHWLIKLSIWTI